MKAEEYYEKIKAQLGTQALLSLQINGGRLYGKQAICKMLEDYHQANLKLLGIGGVSNCDAIFEEASKFPDEDIECDAT